MTIGTTDRLFDHIPTPDDVYAKAFAATIDAGGVCGDDFMLGYITSLGDNGLIDDAGTMALISTMAQGALERAGMRLGEPVCPKCGRTWEGPEDDLD